MESPYLHWSYRFYLVVLDRPNVRDVEERRAIPKKEGIRGFCNPALLYYVWPRLTSPPTLVGSKEPDPFATMVWGRRVDAASQKAWRLLGYLYNG